MRALLLVVVGLVVGVLLGMTVFAPGADNRVAQRRDGGRAARAELARESEPGVAPVAVTPPERVGPKERAPQQVAADADVIGRSYRAKTGRAIPLEVSDALLRESAQQHKWRMENLVQEAVKYEELRARHGIVREGTVLLQARASSAKFISQYFVETAPLDLDSEEMTPKTYVDGGGGVPLGKVLVVERVSIDARFHHFKADGYFWLSLNREQAVSWPKIGTGFRAVYVGRALYAPREERLVRLTTRQGVASVELSTRYVTPEEARALKPERFRFANEGRVGFLSGNGVITVQVLAGDGGGGVSMSGARTGRFDAVSRHPLWDDTLAPAELKRSRFYMDGVGLIPPGKTFVLRRIEYRGRLSPAKGVHSKLLLWAGGKKLVEVDATTDPRPAGAWEGEIPVRSGKAGGVFLELPYFGVGEARFHGELVDAGQN